jgi:hypothetical protein
MKQLFRITMAVLTPENTRAPRAGARGARMRKRWRRLVFHRGAGLGQRPAALRSALALSVRSQVKASPVRPKWP